MVADGEKGAKMVVDGEQGHASGGSKDERWPVRSDSLPIVYLLRPSHYSASQMRSQIPSAIARS